MTGTKPFNPTGLGCVSQVVQPPVGPAGHRNARHRRTPLSTRHPRRRPEPATRPVESRSFLVAADYQLRPGVRSTAPDSCAAATTGSPPVSGPAESRAAGQGDPNDEVTLACVDFVADELAVDHAEALTGLVQDPPGLVDKLITTWCRCWAHSAESGRPTEVVDITQQIDEMLDAVPGLRRGKKRIETQGTTARRGSPRHRAS